MARLLTHFARVPLVALQAVPCQPPLALKPAGLWLSDETDYGWSQYCTDTDAVLAPWAVTCRLQSAAPVCHLQDSAQLLAFTDQYCHPRLARLGLAEMGLLLDWPQVAQDYAGLLITPYQWASRLDSRACWYYGWDCASACIWETSVLEIVACARRGDAA